jgi:pilus assembly protein FimV
LKTISLRAGRFALTGVAAAAIGLMGSSAHALGLGRLTVQSALGESLRAEIDVTSLTSEEAGSLRVRVASPDAYRAAGIDYNTVLPGTQATLQKRSDGRTVLQITSDRAVQEPFVDVILEITWSSGRLVREFTLLLDPPTSRMAQAPTAPVAPSISAAPQPSTTMPAGTPLPAPVHASAPAQTAGEGAAPRAQAERRATPPAPKPAAPSSEAAAAQVAPNGVDEYHVRNGDTLSRIATRTQRPGVSLDQMLVALFRGNPQAFISENMNRLKAGVVLSVPSAQVAQQVSTADARQVIQAQSADFGSYRERLAAGVPEAKTETSSRQASGKVEAAVEDRKQVAAANPDKLKLTQGAVKASGPEAALSKATEQKAANARVAELTRNVEDLKRLSSAASGATGTAPAGAIAAAAPVAATPAPATPTIVAAAPAPAPVAPAPAPSPVAPIASAPSNRAADPAAASAPSADAGASAPSRVAVARPAASGALPKPAARAPEVEEPGILSALLDNSLAIAVAGVAVALLAGFGFYRLRNKAKKESGETSFLESRLQPDSFFGASGGQRIDTRDASGASSSMSYSLSQLDAIGDVDPVAEADVYLAYGRDLQAEEILKEAMRANPERLAIRAKLLEVYAKRRDTKGFELLATQLFSLTRGEGEDWAKAQELGRSIDPENPVYQPGGHPVEIVQVGDRIVEPLGASTMPQSVLPAPPTDLPSTGPDSVVDLDLDLDTPPSPATAPARVAPEITQPFNAPAAVAQPSMSFELPPPAPVAAEQPPAPMEFDLSGLTLDLDPAPAPAPIPAANATVQPSGFGDLGLPAVPEFDAPASGEGGDPLARKLELAEEFRQIGDMEGARDLLEEVVAKASGALKTRAQGMLADLA